MTIQRSEGMAPANLLGSHVALGERVVAVRDVLAEQRHGRTILVIAQACGEVSGAVQPARSVVLPVDGVVFSQIKKGIELEFKRNCGQDRLEMVDLKD